MYVCCCSVFKQATTSPPTTKTTTTNQLTLFPTQHQLKLTVAMPWLEVLLLVLRAISFLLARCSRGQSRAEQRQPNVVCRFLFFLFFLSFFLFFFCSCCVCRFAQTLNSVDPEFSRTGIKYSSLCRMSRVVSVKGVADFLGNAMAREQCTVRCG